MLDEWVWYEVQPSDTLENLMEMDLTDDWPEILQKRFNRVVTNSMIHEFDLPTKISLLQQLAKDQDHF